MKLMNYGIANVQEHVNEYPTLASIALDVLPAQASSVASERIFSSAKLTASDLRSRIGVEKFEKLQLLKFSWKRDLIDMAAENKVTEEVEDESMEYLFRCLEEMDEADGAWDDEEDHLAC